MKTKKTEKAPASKSKKMNDENRSRKMEPLKSKELKNLHFDSEEDEEEVDPETMDDNFKGFDDFEGMDEDEDDF